MRMFGPDGREQPLINGKYYDFSSIELRFGGRIYYGITEISYAASLKPGEILGRGSRRIGRTAGVASHRCNLEMYRGLFDEVVNALGDSYGRVSFDIAVTYAEEGDGVVTDKILGVRVTDVDLANSEGSEPLKVKVTCDPRDVKIGTKNLSIDSPSSAKAAITVVR